MSIEIRILDSKSAHVLEHVAPEVFDKSVNRDLTDQFLSGSRHHIAVALDGKTVIGMASAVDYVHPDKPLQLWINEVGVAPQYHRKGVGSRMINALLNLGRELGCYEAWVGTGPDNKPARGLYDSIGGKSEAVVMYTFDLSKKAEYE